MSEVIVDKHIYLAILLQTLGKMSLISKKEYMQGVSNRILLNRILLNRLATERVENNLEELKVYKYTDILPNPHIRQFIIDWPPHIHRCQSPKCSVRRNSILIAI